MILDLDTEFTCINQPVGYYVSMSKTETSDHILDRAINLFWSRSYHGVNMNELSRSAGVNKATVYQYFPSKEKLAVAAISRGASISADYVYKLALENSTDPQKQLEAIYHRVYEMHLQMFQTEGNCRGCPFVNLGVELSTSSEPIRIAVEAAFDGFKAYYAKIVDSQFGGKLDKVEKKSLVSALMANMNGCLVESKIENRPEAILDGLKRALRILRG